MWGPKKLWICALVSWGAIGIVYIQTERVTPLIAFLSVGQGDAIFIQTQEGKRVLIDAGRSSSVLKELYQFGGTTIDVLIASHQDADHIGGIPSVLDAYTVKLFIEPKTAHESSITSTVEEKIDTENSAHVYGYAGMKLILDSETTLSFLWPQKGIEGYDTNDMSIVLLLNMQNKTFLLTGDSGDTIEKLLVDHYGEMLQSTVLKLGHHGSHTSSSELFLDTVSPKEAIVSAAERNTYGHPAPVVIERLKKRGITVKETKDGTITYFLEK
jgi:competence protein ComEC